MRLNQHNTLEERYNIIDKPDKPNEELSDLLKNEALRDYKIALISRGLSIQGRKEVYSGRATFGIFGDGKEIAQIAYAKCFKNGDWRAGYYRDQTFMLAAGLLTPEEFFHQLYGETNELKNPSSSGRNFNNHFATRTINKDGTWNNLANIKNSSSDVSPTAEQMPRLLGLAYASKLFRNIEFFGDLHHLSISGNEVAFGSIGESSTSEGLFFETINAACVLQVPLAVAIWDDGYGISVPVELQTAKSSISEVLNGFQKNKDNNGCLIYTSKGWDYIQLVKMFGEGIARCRKEHIPVIFHVTEMTQPFGHSTSGSHERYKSDQRLQWEKEFDPIKKMKEWMIEENIADLQSICTIEEEAKNIVKEAKQKAWEAYITPYLEEKTELLQIINSLSDENREKLKNIFDHNKLLTNSSPSVKDMLSTAKKILYHLGNSHNSSDAKKLTSWIRKTEDNGQKNYSDYLYADNWHILKNVHNINPVYSQNPCIVHGREIINRNFDYLLQKYPLLVIFGEDTGKLGDVNGGLKGLQQKYGDLRVTDTGIREATIIGQGIGLALRGFRPIAEIQYLDYLVYALHVLTDDVATLHYRTKGQQIAPLIIRTRGHRLIGIWHSGSPLGMMLNSLRGINICVPRNMTQAAGFYNTLLETNDPAIIIEPLNGYNQNEYLPENIGEFKFPLGVSEIITAGSDITIVTYGWCVSIAKEAVARLKAKDISVELIDVQTLIPFDINQIIKKSIIKTNKVLFLDEDVPGGATAYMMQKVLEEQGAFYYLDSAPKTLSAREHRPAYGTDGDYFSKPNAETIIDAVYNIMREVNPAKYPDIYQSIRE
jgi:2-oxoisovalerate dehydrogenase E1 component